jgi:SpoVK/Ycf46/Vps4 family AAA+-type ATPase
MHLGGFLYAENISLNSYGMNSYGMNNHYSYRRTPSETITKIEKVSKIVKTEIREFSKPFDTLYLRKEDKDKLLSMLQTYEKRDQIFEELGIPKKLGILAHGLPGTGKTTTILAIADHLGLDVYYLNLNGIKLNSQLKELFDYIIKENIMGGLIVFEDIDAMTDIVLKRTETTDSSSDASGGEASGGEANGGEASGATGIKDIDDKLSLSYLLNLLDGTLCMENTMFIITTNFKNKLDPALYRKGRIDVDIEFTGFLF